MWKDEEITQSNILKEAVERCLTEMYAKSQPSASWEELVKLTQEGVYNETNKFIDQHYLSQEEYVEIEEKYIHAYNLTDLFQYHCDVVLDYLVEGGLKDKYMPGYTDDDGNWHPPYRDYEKTPLLKDIIGEENANKCLELINDCKNFYNTNHREVSFRMLVMDYSPTSNIDTVRQYWKEKDCTVQINERTNVEED